MPSVTTDPSNVRVEVTTLSTRWPEIFPSGPVPFANQVVCQIASEPSGAPGEILVSIGYASAPLITGPGQEQEEQMRSITHVPISLVARFAMSRDRAVELQGALAATIAAWDEGARQPREGANG